MGPEINKAVMLRYTEMWNTGNAALADDLFAEGYVDHAWPDFAGPESVKQVLQRLRTEEPAAHIAIEHIISEGDLVALHYLIHRTQQGQPVATRAMAFVRLTDGKLAEMWTCNER